jgi:putative membrane-bound dehydrogenase-like protein
MNARPLAVLLVAAALVSANASTPPAASDFQTDPRLEIQLWAAEPHVVDPVAIAFDEQGRAYVAECRDYPYGTGPNGKVGSTIRLLQDTDADGRADRSTLFATNISYATSVTPWRGGVLVAAAPDLLFLKDTDGDGISDVREVLATGFLLGVSDSLVNGLRFGPDNRIHGANGGNGGRLRSPRGGSSVDLGDNDFSINPDTGSIHITGPTGGGFGLVFDVWGRAFTTYNIDHIQHRYLEVVDGIGRKGLPGGPTTVSVSDHGEMARIFPISAAVTRPNHPEQSGHFSAAGGMGYLGAHGWPEDLAGSVFVCDVVGNLVHRDLIRSSGAALVASRPPGEHQHEFLASRDPAFRPVGLEAGPDGALYLLDMQREVIEHPDYIPAKAREKVDVRQGSDRGRIWRIRPRNLKPSPIGPDGFPDANALLAGLRHPDQWWRVTAQRLIVERRAVTLVPALKQWVADASTTSTPPTSVLHALWSLDGLGALEASDLAAGLRHPTSEVREATLRLVNLELANHASLEPLVRNLTRDIDGRVRFRAAIALRHAREPASFAALAELLTRDANDRWIRRAVLIAVTDPDRPRLLDQMLASARSASISATAIREVAESAASIAEVWEPHLQNLLGSLGSLPNLESREALLGGLREGIARRAEPPTWSPGFLDFLRQSSDRLGDGEAAEIWAIAKLGRGAFTNPERLGRAWSNATNASRAGSDRVQAISLLTHAESPAPLVSLLGATEPIEVQTAALKVLREQRATPIGVALVAAWRTYGPETRPGILKLILDRRNFHEPLISALEKGALTVGELHLDLEQRRRLLRGSSPDISRRAARFMSDEEYSNRRQTVEDWLRRLPPVGDASRGREYFRQSCASCHRCGDIGQRVGPDLSGVAHRSVEDLLGNILDPNMAINPGFIAYNVETKDGETVSGLMAQGSGEVITLIQAGGIRSVIHRRDAVRVASSGSSLMPEGLESGRTPQDLRDLIAFIQEAR